MAPPLAAVSWSDGLHIELLVLIFLNLHCIADRASFAVVCHSWQNAKLLAEAGGSSSPPPRQVPWLLPASPSHGQGGPCITSFLSGFRRRIRSLPDDISRSRLCGAHPGGWVTAVLTRWGQQVLFNVLSRARIHLPHRMKLESCMFSTVTPVTIRSVVLSAAPNNPDLCIAGAIVSGTSNVAFCRPGIDRYWKACFPVDERLQDIVYFEGEDKEMRGFHVLTEAGHVVVFRLAYIQGHDTMFVARLRYNSMMPICPDTLLPFLPRYTSITRYLVVSRQRLLMVVRYFCQRRSGVCRTLLFRVFQMQVAALVPQRNGRMATWAELKGLDGRVLFVGRGCSRAYEAAQLQGFREGSIYFIDDAKSDLAFAPKYRSSDVGMYSMSTVVRPSLDAPVYGTQTYLCWIDDPKNKATNVASKILVEMGEDEARTSGSNIMGIRWNFPSEPLSQFSPPIWVAP